MVRYYGAWFEPVNRVIPSPKAHASVTMMTRSATEQSDSGTDNSSAGFGEGDCTLGSVRSEWSVWSKGSGEDDGGIVFKVQALNPKL